MSAHAYAICRAKIRSVSNFDSIDMHVTRCSRARTTMPANIREFLGHPADVGGGDVTAAPPRVFLLVIFKIRLNFDGQPRFGRRVG